MNSACIIAACAASSRRTQENTKDNVSISKTSNINFTYKVTLRKYYYFDSMTIVVPNGEEYYGSIFAPYVSISLKPVKLEGRVFANQYTFTISKDKCEKGIDNYIKENIEKYEHSTIWIFKDKEIIDKYLFEIRDKYNVELEPSSLNFTTQYCWEVEPYVY